MKNMFLGWVIYELDVKFYIVKYWYYFLIVLGDRKVI